MGSLRVRVGILREMGHVFKDLERTSILFLLLKGSQKESPSHFGGVRQKRRTHI